MTTIYDIAGMAGVSAATVSRYLNGSATVSPDTAARIQKAVDETGFTPSRVASSLTTKRTGLIGFLTNEIMNPFTAEVCQAMTEEAADHGFTLLTAVTGGREERLVQMLTELRRHQVDGVIVTPPLTPRTESALAELVRSGTALTTIGIDLRSAGASFVSVDTYQGAVDAAQHLLDLGHRDIAFVGSDDPGVAQGRLAGYRETLTRASVTPDPSLVLGESLDSEGGARALDRLAGMDPFPTAVLTVNDVMALGVLQAAHARRIRIPDELSVVGFDDIAMASLASPPLTTVAQPKTELGRSAARSLIEQLTSGRVPDPKRLTCTLVVRASTARPPGHPG